MSAFTTHSQKLIPAQVGFLAIYNPSLGNTDDTLDDQIVYYYSSGTQGKRRRRRRLGADNPPQSTQEEKNERLRKIGLAQGMVEFGRDFSGGRPVDTIETEKSRIVLHELESGWWLIASIDLTRLPMKGNPGEEDGIEYSSREVKPPALLLEDLLRAHSAFLLHHASSMSAFFVRSRRPKFVNLLGRYWDSFLSTWNVMLHGNPVVNVYGGIKLAASGELGMGVGEEDRGSGEREVLEGFVGRIEGLVDLVVSKFGDSETEAAEKGSKETQVQSRTAPSRPWLGTGAEPTSDDGAIFLGVGALSRKSLRDITHWMEDLYSWGSRAYGVQENPTSTRKARQRADKERPDHEKLFSSSQGFGSNSSHATMQLRPGITQANVEEQPKLLNSIRSIPSPIQEVPEPYRKTRSKDDRPSLQRKRSSQSSVHSLTTTGGKFSNYFKLGYGTHWSLGGNPLKMAADNGDKQTKQGMEGTKLPDPALTHGVHIIKKNLPAYEGASDSSLTPVDDTIGHYMIGLMGDIESDESLIGDNEDPTTEDGLERGTNYRLLLRTVTVELERERDARAERDISIDLGMADSERTLSSKHGGSEHTGTSHASFESQDRNKTKKLRIVVYVNKPFIFTFLFELRTDALALLSLYRSLHHQLGPLQRPLLTSTSRPPSKPDIGTTTTKEVNAPIYDLVWDSKLMTISSTIPNIPEPLASPTAGTKPPPWSRIEALNTHMQLLNTFTATRSNRLDLESTCKTSRGWWIVWTRIPDPDIGSGSATSQAPSPLPGSRTPQLRQEDSLRTGGSRGTSMTTGLASQSIYSGPAHPFLDRDTAPRDLMVSKDKEIFLLRRASDYVEGKSSGLVMGEGGWGSGPAKLAQGIGVDTKRYIEGLLNMNR